MLLRRKKAKISKSPAAAEVFSENVLHGFSDKNDMPESEMTEKETENDVLPMSQCQPMLLSQYGKFIPKFMAKKKVGECIVKLERAPKVVESNYSTVPASETEYGIESRPCGTGTNSLADEVKDSAYEDSVDATDTCTPNDNDESVPVECVAELEADKHDEADNEQSVSAPNNGFTDSIDSNEQRLAADASLQHKDMVITDQRRDESQGREIVEEKKTSNILNCDVLSEVHHSASTDLQHDVDFDAAKLLSLSSSTNVTSHLVVETAPVAEEDCTVSLFASHESSQRMVVADEAMQAGIAVCNDSISTAISQSELNTASDHPVVDEICSSSQPMPETVMDDVEAQPDPESADDNQGKVAVNDAAQNSITLNNAVCISGRDGGEQNKACIDLCDSVPSVIGAVEDHKAETGSGSNGRMRIKDGTVSETMVEVTTIGEGPPKPCPMFDDLLDLTDSQLCQFDNVSRSVLCTLDM